MSEDVVKNYHRMFTKIKRSALQAIQGAVNNGLWRVETEEGYDVIRELYMDLSAIYNVPVPTLIVDSNEYYRPYDETIGLPRVSLVSCLHEYRHHMQKYGMLHYSDIEVDARAWSISSFKCALPEAFDKAWKRGRIWFLPPYPEAS